MSCRSSACAQYAEALPYTGQSLLPYFIASILLLTIGAVLMAKKPKRPKPRY